MRETESNSKTFILLELAGTTYGVRSQFVQQLEMLGQISPVPNAAAAVEGVVFSRGQVIPVINLRARFGFPRIEPDLRARLVVIKTAGRVVGLIVDTAREFASIPPEAIKAAPEALTNLSGEYIEGIAALGDRLIILLNLDEVITSGDKLEVPSDDVSRLQQPAGTA